MRLPDAHTHRLIDGLARSRFSFALYRLPWTDECRFVLQTSDAPQRLNDLAELNKKRGFVMAPFRGTEQHPSVLIRPETTAYGWAEISRSLAAKVCADALPACERTSAAPRPPLSEEERYSRYAAAFERFIRPLKAKTYQKLVLSRPAFCPIGEDFSPLETFVKACNAYPRMMIYLCHTPVTGTWMGSTPEILLSGGGERWHTVALAGTVPYEEGAEAPLWSDKNKEEQALVTRYIHRIVCKFGDEVTKKGPCNARAGQLIHLKTDFLFRLKDTDFLGDLLKELHPTPAVCGLPKAEAYRFIGEQEGYDRRYYSGFAGWLDPEGQTDLYVNLRCMEIRPAEVKLYAGGGLLPSSDVRSEWTETGEKMKTMKSLL